MRDPHLKYIMVGPARTVVVLDTRSRRELLRWARWFETADRRIGLTVVGGCEISTVFLGLDLNFQDFGPPILFETMVFEAEGDRGTDMYMERYETLADAQAGHARIVARVEKEVAEANATVADIIKHLCTS